MLLIIDAKSERAAKWYAGYGAEPLENQPLTLVMPVSYTDLTLPTKRIV